jgi:capsular polysaccharide biosynthesis protein
MSGSTADDLVRRAETAWRQDDLKTSTGALRALAGARDDGVCEARFEPYALPRGISAEPLSFHGKPLTSHLVRFESAAALFDIGVPIAPDGTFYSRAFAHLKYPERYTHLFTDDADKAVRAAVAKDTAVKDGYVTVIRPPYYHWLLDTVPHLLGASRLTSCETVNLIGPADAPLKPWQQELLARAAGLFGIANLGWLPVSGTVVAVAPGYSQTRMPLDQRLDVIARLAPKTGTAKPNRVIYAKRGKGDARRLINEDDVIAALEPRVEVIEPGAMTLDDQMRTFAGARCVIGVHGSNLTNIAFCRPGATVIEIAAGLPQTHFEKLCRAAGLRFHRVAADPAVPSAGDKAEPSWADAHGDLRANPAEIKNALTQALDEPR